MTRKDYELIAETIAIAYKANAHSWHADPTERQDAVRGLAIALAVNFQDENPRFDIRKFYKACGIITPVTA